MTVLIILLTITKRGESPAASGSPKDKRTFKKLLKKPADTLKRLAGENGEENGIASCYHGKRC